MCNLIYMHLRPDHAPECRQRCAVHCPQQAFEAWLDAPLLAHHQRRAERQADRLAQLARGEIPART